VFAAAEPLFFFPFVDDDFALAEPLKLRLQEMEEICEMLDMAFCLHSCDRIAGRDLHSVEKVTNPRFDDGLVLARGAVDDDGDGCCANEVADTNGASPHEMRELPSMAVRKGAFIRVACILSLVGLVMQSMEVQVRVKLSRARRVS
jgi:hypothetical protein